MFRYCFALFFIFYSSIIFAEERRGPDISIGASVFDGSLTVSTKDTGATQGEFQQMISSPFILYDSPAIIEGDRVDMIIKAGYGRFDLDSQEPDHSPYISGTYVKGDFAYVMPMFYVYPTRFGSTSYFSQGLRYGMGLGLGYLRAKGRMAYHGDLYDTYAVDVNEFGVSFMAEAEYRISNLYLRLYGYTLEVKEGKYKDYPLTYEYNEVGISLGYAIKF